MVYYRIEIFVKGEDFPRDCGTAFVGDTNAAKRRANDHAKYAGLHTPASWYAEGTHHLPTSYIKSYANGFARIIRLECR